MDKIEKQLRKMSEKQRDVIFVIISKIVARDLSGLNVKKLKGFDHIFRVRIGNYRIIYFDDGNTVILKAIRRRNESTYSDF